MKLRLIDSPEAGGGSGSDARGVPGALNMGIDEAVLRGVARSIGSAAGAEDAGRDYSSLPSLRFYRWSPPCVTVGYFENIEQTVDLDAARRAGVDVVRRVTAGGSVFHNYELTYSIILPLGCGLAPLDIVESYRRICSGLTAGIGELGVEAHFVPVNDIEAGGKKISGNAQTRKRGVLLQHGTILLDLDLELMFSLLRVSDEKLRRKLVEKAGDRVTSLRVLLGRTVDFAEAARAMRAGFVRAFAGYGVELEDGGLSADELAEARELAASRYSTREWNFKPRPRAAD